MKDKFIKIIIYIFCMLNAFQFNALAANTSSIAITVTLEEIISDVIVSPPAGQNGDPGETLTYTFIVKNNGDSPDSYSLDSSSSHNWKTRLLTGNTIGPLNAGEQVQVDINLTIRKRASAGMEDILMLQATSLSDSSVSASGNVITTVNRVADVNIRTRARRRVRAGDTLTVQVAIRNRGNGDDSFDLSAASALGWNINFPEGDTVGPLEPRAKDKIPVTITIPADAGKGETDTVTITAASQFDASVTDYFFVTITVR